MPMTARQQQESNTKHHHQHSTLNNNMAKDNPEDVRAEG
jgi:hypothetical protein